MSLARLLDPPQYRSPVELRPSRFPRQPLTVLCVWVRPKYTMDHVRKLRAMVRRNLSVPHRFVCLTDASPEDRHSLSKEGIDTIPTPYNWPGWWQKIALFNPELFPNDCHLLYFDLDVVVTSTLDAFVCVADQAVAIANFGVNFRHSKYNSSVMFWQNGALAPVYDRFWQLTPGRVMKALHGDQCWLWRVMQDNVAVWPSDWVRSYKYDVRRGGPVPPIVVFHGDPKPTEVNDQFVKEHYRL